MENGTRLGPYEIQDKLGAGGMGEVWRATDTRLGRKVAVKVLPARFATDPERLARFEQEARAAAALNHPNIAVVFDVGEADGVHYMVQELLEGHSLRHVLHEGQPLLQRALELSTQVARALASAHRAGIVHRDLKPDNVFVTRDGQAKVLDFGLAKLLDGGAASDLTESPTVLGSVVGQVMGTAGYMAPEQVSAGTVDARADVFAFGCLLFETVTGRRAFPGDTVFEMLNGILKNQPEALSNIDMELPLELQRVISKCLQKDPGRRYQSTDDLVVDMENLDRTVADGSAIPLSAQSALGLEALAPVVTPSRWTTALVAVTAAAVALLAGYWLGSDAPSTDDTAITRFSFPLDEGQQIQDGLLVSRDGRRLAYSVLDPEGLKVMLRPLDREVSAPVDGTLGAVWPFFSPDGSWLGFSVGDDLLKVPIAGGTPLQLGMATEGGLASWGVGGGVLFSDDGTLYTVPAAGGERTVVASPPEGIWYRRPRYLADTNDAVAELVELATNIGQVALVDVATGDTRVLIDDGWDARYVPTGHLIYTREDGIWAVGFDLSSRTVVGDPVRVLTGVLQRFAQAQFDVSDTGVMAYVPEAATANTEGLTWLPTGDDAPAGVFAEVDGNVSQPRISPDGRRIALRSSEGDGSSIWVYDAARETVALFAEGADSLAWSRGGDQLYYTPRGGGGIYRQRLALGAEPELVLASDDRVVLTDVAPGDAFLLFTRDGDVFRLELRTGTATGTAAGTVERVLDRPYDEWGAVLSPDGNWLAYTAERAGRDEVFVSSYPEMVQTEQISSGGGSNPRWSPDGRALFYTNTLGDTYSPHDIWRVPIGGGSRLDPGVATRIHTQVLDQRFEPADYDVAADGRLIVPSYQAAGVAPQRIHVVLNWFTELQQLVPGAE